MAQSLEQLRKSIDEIDQKLIELFHQRFSLAENIRLAKVAMGKAIHDPTRELEVLERLSSIAREKELAIAPAALRSIFASIMRESRGAQAKQRVGLLGPAGSFSHIASLQYAGYAQQMEFYPSFSSAAQALVDGQVGLCVLPVENSIGGTVGETLDVLWQQPVAIEAEIVLPVRHALMTTGDSNSLSVI